jgi:hypothetical protein
MYWRRRSYFLLEVLVGLWIVSISISPMIYTHVQLLKSEYESCYEIMSRKMAYDAYLEFKEHLYTHHIDLSIEEFPLSSIIEYPLKESIDRVGRFKIFKLDEERKITVLLFFLETSHPILNKNLEKLFYYVIVRGAKSD